MVTSQAIAPEVTSLIHRHVARQSWTFVRNGLASAVWWYHTALNRALRATGAPALPAALASPDRPNGLAYVS